MNNLNHIIYSKLKTCTIACSYHIELGAILSVHPIRSAFNIMLTESLQKHPFFLRQTAQIAVSFC